MFGLSAANTPARLTPSSNPGAAAAILKVATDGSLTLASAALGTAQLGGASNYIDVAADGVLALIGTAKRHLSMRPTIMPSKVVKSGSDYLIVPTMVDRGAATGYSLPIYSAGNDEEIFFSEYIAGRWDGASDIVCSVIGYIDTAETDGDDFALQLSWANKAITGGTWPSATNDVVVETDLPSPRNAQFSIFKVNFTIDWDLPATDVTSADFFAGRLRRIAVSGGGAVEMAGEFVVLAVVVSYAVDKMYKA
jgi:hypothetical protein